MSHMWNEEELAEQLKRIDSLRTQAVANTAQSQTDSLFVTSPQRNNAQKALLSEGKVNANMSVNQFLDLWLEQEKCGTATPAGAEMLPPPLPSISNSNSSAALSSALQARQTPTNNSFSNGDVRSSGNNPLVNSALQSLRNNGSTDSSNTKRDNSNINSNSNSSNGNGHEKESVEAMIERLQTENRALRQEKEEILLQRDVVKRQQGVDGELAAMIYCVCI